MKRKKITEKINITYDYLCLSGHIDGVILALQDIRERADKRGYKNIQIDIGSIDDIWFDIRGTRYETEKEKLERLERNRKAKDARKQKKCNKCGQTI